MGLNDVSKCLPCDYIIWASLRASYGLFSFSMGLTLSEYEGHLEEKGPQGGTAPISRGQWLLLLLRNLLAIPRRVILITLTEMKPHINSAVLKDHLVKASLFLLLRFSLQYIFTDPR